MAGMRSFWLSEIASILPAGRVAPPAEADRDDETGYISVAIEDRRSGGELALDAMRELIARVGKRDAARAGAIMHASIADQGMGIFWNPGLALQHIAGAANASALSLRQGCNGLLSALTQAARMGYGSGPAILIGSDRFADPGFDRFAADYGIMYGDGAAGFLAGGRSGRYRVIDMVQVVSPELAALHDGRGLRSTDIRAAKKRYLELNGKDRLTTATREAMSRISHSAEEHGVERLLFPNLGRQLLEENYYPAFDRAEERSAAEIGRRLGHLGTTDQLIALHTLTERGDVVAGTRLMLIGAGSGFSWSGIVVEVE